MIPFLLAALGGYLIGDSIGEDIDKKLPEFADGGMMAKGGEVGDEVTLLKDYGYRDLSKYGDFQRFKGGEKGVFIKGNRKLGNEIVLKLNNGTNVITQINAIDLPTIEEKEELYEKNKHLFSFGYADGGVMANGG